VIRYEQFACEESGVTYRLTPELYQNANRAEIFLTGSIWFLVDDGDADPSQGGGSPLVEPYGLFASGNPSWFLGRSFPIQPTILLKSPAEVRNFRCRRFVSKPESLTGLTTFNAALLKIVYRSGFRVEG
jgi:hypothetical protein